MDENTIFYSLLFSFIGMGFWAYGKNGNLYFRICGLILMVFPYFVSTLTWLVIIGFGLIAFTFFLEWFYPI